MGSRAGDEGESYGVRDIGLKAWPGSSHQIPGTRG